MADGPTAMACGAVVSLVGLEDENHVLQLPVTCGRPATKRVNVVNQLLSTPMCDAHIKRLAEFGIVGPEENGVVYLSVKDVSRPQDK